MNNDLSNDNFKYISIPEHKPIHDEKAQRLETPSKPNIEIIDNSKITYIGYFYENNNEFYKHPILPLRKCVRSPIQNVNSKELIEKLKLIQKKYAKIKYKIGFSTCRICHDNNKCNEYYIDYFVWPAGYLHYLEDHNVEMDEKMKKFIESFDYSKTHFTDFDYKY